MGICIWSSLSSSVWVTPPPWYSLSRPQHQDDSAVNTTGCASALTDPGQNFAISRLLRFRTNDNMLDLLEAHVKFSLRFLAQSTFIFTAIPESQSMDVLSRRPAHRPYRYKYRAQALTPESREGIPPRESPSVPQVLHYSVSLSVGWEGDSAHSLRLGWGQWNDGHNKLTKQNHRAVQLALQSSDWLVSAIKGTPMYTR